MLNFNLLDDNESDSADLLEVEELSMQDIAIIGLSAQLPLVNNLEQFWDYICNGVDFISEFPESRRNDMDPFANIRNRTDGKPAYYEGAYLDHIDKFDYAFFRLSPKEASLMSPNQRLFLQTVWKSVEDAGYCRKTMAGSRTGIFVGFNADSLYDYKGMISEVDPELLSIAVPGNISSIIAGRISYLLDLRGPSLCVDTACSSSLVAIHLACQSIRNQECEMAIAGSVKINLLPLANELKIGIESSSWRARSFDDSSDGTGAGEGVISFVLKPLSKALQDGDSIHAVIKGSAMNQDGSSVGMTAPNVLAQEDVILRAWNNAGIDPETISYIEAHGTGTKLGDPIEIAAIELAFRRFTDRKQFVALGSVKASIGHLDHAAGAVGLLKSILSLKYKQIPPLVHFTKPNRSIDFLGSPVYVNNKLTDWLEGDSPRRCGISAFGMSGTNCHLVLEEAPIQQKQVESVEPLQASILAISAKNDNVLKELVEQYVVMLKMSNEIRLDLVCFVANTGRDHYEHRVAIVFEGQNDLLHKLSMVVTKGLVTNEEYAIYSGFQKPSSMDSSGLEVDGVDLQEIAKQYVQGKDIEWSSLYRNRSYQKVHIPTYPFVKTRCWLDVNESLQLVSSQASLVKGTNSGRLEVALLGRESGEYSLNEQIIAQIWGETLGFHQFNVDDNFFELGGDSILALKIANQVSIQLSVSFHVSELFKYTSIEAISKHVETQSVQDSRQSDLLNTLIPASPSEEYPLTPSQYRVFVQEQFSLVGTDNNTPFCIMVEGAMDTVRFNQAFRALVDRHESLRTSFTFINGEAIQQVVEQVDFQVSFYESSLSRLDALIRSFIRPFDLSSPPLIRVGLATINANQHLIMIDLHHIISDGVSSSILIKEFCDLYKGIPLADLKIHYKDYAVWQRNTLHNGGFEAHKQYWLNQLSGVLPLLDMPIDFRRPEKKAFNGHTIRVPVAPELKLQLERLAKSQGITMNILLFSLYTLMLHQYSKQEQLVVGTLVAGRNHPDLEHVFGMFINFLPIKVSFERVLSFTDYLSLVHHTIVDAYVHDYPFDQILIDLQIKTDRARNPIYDTMFVYHNEYNMNPTNQLHMEEVGLKFSEYTLPSSTAPLDMKLDVWNDTMGQLVLAMQYDTALFTERTIQMLMEHFLKLAHRLVANPELILSQLDVISDAERIEIVAKRAALGDGVNPSMQVVISSTFTSEPVGDYLSWWCQQFNVQTEASFAAYNQVFQELLNPNSLLRGNDGINVLLIRFEDWIRDDIRNGDTAALVAKLETIYKDLEKAFENRGRKAPYIIGIFPLADESIFTKEVIACIENLNTRWEQFLSTQEQVFTIQCDESLAATYQVSRMYDPVKDLEGHLPYTDEFYAVIGTAIARKLVAWKRQEFKVIVLDCDNTLWKGVCGEDGPLNVEISGPYIELQKFMLDRYNEGMLLAICSKNNGDDVWEVFANHPDMLLRQEHFVASKINWGAKSANVQELAEQLNVGLDSLVFIDDSPMECTEMMQHCSEVLTLQLPEDTRQISSFLQHVWAFDKLVITDEDRKRTILYVAESKRRDHLEDKKSSIEEFLSSLDLRIRMIRLLPEHVPRAAQLTQRTNQFNMNTLRRSEAEIQALLSVSGTACWGVEVEDRFGEYGFVGLIIGRLEQGAFVLDTFLLSCRVLGRQVEHTIVTELSRYAKSNSAYIIAAPFVASTKNAPFKEFLDATEWMLSDALDGSKRYERQVDSIPAHPAYITLLFDRKINAPVQPHKHDEIVRDLDLSRTREETASSSEAVESWDWSILGLDIEGLRHAKHLLPLSYHNADKLLTITRKQHPLADLSRGEYDKASNETERELVHLWEAILGVQPIGAVDHFFDIGGNSLQAVSLASRIHQHFHVQLSLRDLLEAPSIRQLARLIDRSGQSVYASIIPIADQDHYPVTSAQKRLLVLNELDAGSTAYNQPCFFRVDGPLNIEEFESVCLALIHRHQVLRTVFHWEQDEFVQRVMTSFDFSVEHHEVGEASIEEWIGQFIRPFNLKAAPLFRAGVIRMNEQSHLLMFDMHHIVSDGISISILVREFNELYQGNSLPELQIQYRDYAVWQHNLMSSAHMQEQEQYWLRVFADSLPVLNLPLDLPRPAVRGFEGNRYSFEMDQSLYEAVEKLAFHAGATPYMVFLAAYNVLLAKYSGQEDILVGSPIAGRPHADLDPIIGMFVSTLVLRNKPQGDKTFRQFIASVKENTLQAFEHQDYPFEQLVERLNIQRDLSRNPVFDTMFVYQNMSWTTSESEQLQFHMHPYDSGRSRFDLTLELAEHQNGLHVHFEYATGLFHIRTIERLARHFLQIIKAGTQAPDMLLSHIDMLEESERARLLFGYNATQVEYERDKTIQQRFEDQVAKSPEDIAVVYGSQSLTYLQLNHRANRLAHELRAIGVKPNQIVGIQVERSLEMIVAVIGVLKSGGAYLPIDPQYPEERTQYMLDDSLTGVVITHSHLANRIPDHVRCLFVDDERFMQEESSHVSAVNSSNDLAYVIYTSGSTGKPKGVMVEHKGMINLQVYFQEKLGVTNKDRIVQFASFSFDASVWEMFMGLFNGAELHLLSPEVTNNYHKFEQYLNEHSITIATLPPTYLTGLNPDRMDTLCKVITAGSSSTLELLEKWRGKLQYINAYGPTESTICATAWLAPMDGNLVDMNSVPIGTPIPNMQVYIVNAHDQLQPIGIPGELCIGGAGLSRGYLHRPELTAQQFIANPFIPGMRMYKTGDLVRWLSNGTIEYLGRIDDQVKIRGYRIELGEVENCLLKHPQVEQCVVMARGGLGSQGDNVLCAYIGTGDQQLEAHQIRSFVSRHLPDYMVPTFFMMMDHLPLTSNGKVDKKALPEPEITRIDSYEAPINDIELRLTQLWVDILGIDRIGLKDHFFELGGHSLKAITLLTRIHQDLQVELSLKQIFQSPTIELLAKEVEKALPSSYAAIPIADSMPSYPLSAGQKKLYVLQQLEGLDTAYNISGAYKVEGTIDLERLNYACSALIARHEALRTSFAVENGEFVQYIHADVKLNIHHIETSEEQLEEVVRGQIATFDLSERPLMRVVLIKLSNEGTESDEKHILFFDIHHIVSDGVSTSIMIQDFLRLYEGITLPDLRIQYKDFAVWQNSPAVIEASQRQEQYWMDVLARGIPTLEMPTDFPRPTVQSYGGSRVHQTIDRQLTERLRALAIESGSTLYMVLLSGYSILLSKYSGQEDIIIGTPTAGRTHADLQPIIGMFVNTLVIRNQPTSDQSFYQFLDAVRENTIQAFDNQDYPFDQLVERLRLPRDVSRNPLFDAMFILQNFNIAHLKADQLTVSPYPFLPSIAKFDLSLEVTEGDEELNFTLDYAIKLYREETAHRLLVDYIKILTEIASNPEIKLQDIQLIEQIVKRKNVVLTKEIEFNF